MIRVRLASLTLVGVLVAALGGVVLDRPPGSSAPGSIGSRGRTQVVAVLLDQQQEQLALAVERAVRAARAVQAATRLALTQKAAAQRVARLATAQRAAAQRAAALKAAAQRAGQQVALERGTSPSAVIAPTGSTPVVARAAAVASSAVRVEETAAQRGTRVLASLHYPWQRLGYRIQFLPDKHGYLGLTVPGTKLIQIYVRSSQSDLVLAHSIAHEIGHALDFTRNGPTQHALYLSTRGLSTRLAWFGCSGCSDYRTPAGDWAEVFAYWLAGPGDFRSQVQGPPSATQLRLLAPLFRL